MKSCHCLKIQVTESDTLVTTSTLVHYSGSNSNLEVHIGNTLESPREFFKKKETQHRTHSEHLNHNVRWAVFYKKVHQVVLCI